MGALEGYRNEVKGTKTCCCIECGISVEVTKFATPAKVKCDDCKAATKQTKHNKGPVYGTKAWAIEQFQKAELPHEILDGAIDKAVEDGKVKGGFALVHSLTMQYSWNWMYGTGEDKQCKLYGTGRKKSKIWDYQYHTKRIRENREQAFEELEEAGADFTWFQWVAGKYGVTDDKFEAYVICSGMIDGMIDGEYEAEYGAQAARERAAQSIIDNEVDCWNDHQRKHGWV